MFCIFGFLFVLFCFQRFYLFINYVHNILLPCISAHQKRAPDLFTDGCEPPCGCWELNSGPLEEQSVRLTSEPSLQPPCFNFFNPRNVYHKNSVGTVSRGETDTETQGWGRHEHEEEVKERLNRLTFYFCEFQGPSHRRSFSSPLPTSPGLP